MRKITYDRSKCMACRSCEVACAIEHTKSKDIFKALSEKDKPLPRRHLKPSGSAKFTVSCFHCEDPVCVEACIVSALKKEENGKVICDTAKCIDCGMCVMVCPFGAITVSETFIIKCDLCPDRDDTFACIQACPTKALKEKK